LEKTIITDIELSLETKSIKKLVWEYALPAIIGTITTALHSIIDRMFIGHGVSALAISGLGITFPVMILTSSVGLLVGAGATSRISLALGEKNKERAEQILGNSLLLLIVLNIIVTAVFLLYLKPILMAFGASELTYPYARDYLQIIIPGNIFVSMCFSFNNMMRVSGYPKKAMYTMFIGAVCNVILTPLFIFGFGMGIRGTAVSTVIAMFVGLIFVMYHFVQPDSLIRLKMKYIRFNWTIIIAIVSIGLSPFLMQAAATLVAILMNTQLMKYGDELAVGAFSIYNSLAMVVVMVAVGLNQGMQPIIGYNYGAKKYDRVKATLFYGMKMATIITSIGFILGMFLPQFLAYLFTTDPHLIGITERGTRIAMLAFPVIGFQIVASSYFQSIGQAKKSIILTLIRQILFLIPALWILPNFFGLDGVWVANPVSDFVAAMVSIGFLIHQSKALNKLIDESKL
jgi:putative MATE family efflux protein